MNRRSVSAWMIFSGLLVGFVLFLWIWFHTEPAAPGDFSR
jgi:hypothetical protein